MASKQTLNPHLKPLEQAMGARFGWQTGASWRDKLQAAVKKKADKLGMDELAYCRMAVKSAAELEVLADLVTNCETRFYREPDQFEALRTRVIPELVDLRAKERRLDIWSAACSTGEEAYSLAILLRESLPQGEDWKINLFATDLRGASIMSASHGRYPSSKLSPIDPRLQSRYFVKADNLERERAYDVAPNVRKMVAFRRANLYDAQFWKNMGLPFDLILCNNLLLYFHALAAKQTVDRFATVLKKGGLLIVMRNEASYVEHPLLRLDGSLPGSFFRKI